MTDNKDQTIIDKLDSMIQKGTLETREGLELMFSLYKDETKDRRTQAVEIQELKSAAIRFTNLGAEAKVKEEQNGKDLAALKVQIDSISKIVSDIVRVSKWAGGLLTLVIGALLVGIATGQFQIAIIRP